MEQPSKFQHQLQPDIPSSSTMSPSPHGTNSAMGRAMGVGFGTGQGGQ